MDIHQKNVLALRDLLKRRFFFFFLPFLLLLTATAAVAFLLPVSYSSSTTILAEESDIPADLVGTPFTSFVNQRIDELTQFIMSRKTLGDLIERHNLYPDLRAKLPLEAVVEQMKEDIVFETNSTNVIPQGSGRPMQATLSFTITYENRDPRLAFEVTRDLADLYVSRNTEKIEKRLDESTGYLEAKKQDLEQEIQSIEKRIAEFKEAHAEEMPDLYQTNLENLREAETEVKEQTAAVLNLKQRKAQIEGDLKKTKPYADMVQPTGEKVVDPEDQLDALRFEYITKRATMSDKHPDILALKKSISELETVVARKQRLIDAEKRLTTLETAYADLSGRTTPQHPDRIRLENEIRQLRSEIAALSQEVSERQEVPARVPDNPAYIDLQTQLKIAELNLKEAEEKLAAATEKRRSLQARIQATPSVEKAYLDLTRDYESLKQQYQDTLTQIAAAKAAKGVEQEKKGEKFTILDPANLPETPSEPNVPVVFLLGIVLSLSVGLGCVYLVELVDPSVRSATELESATGLPVLSTIPYVNDDRDRARARMRKIATALGFAYLVGLVAWSVYYYQQHYT